MMPYYASENVTLYILPTLSGIDAVVADPPYGISYEITAGMHMMPSGKRRWYPGADSVIGNDKEFDPAPYLTYPLVVLWGANHFAHNLPHNGKWLIWDKRCGVIPQRTQADCELAWCNKYGAARVFRHMWDGMVRDSERETPRVHPTQKPVELMTWCMGQASIPKGATVLDPFMGSGTTGVACIRTGRKFVGIEIDENYAAIARRRIVEAEAQLMLPGVTP